jgi:hypothetical protein
VDGKPVDAYPVAKQILIGAGFGIDEELGPACDLPPSSAACVLVAARDSDLLQVSVFNPGDDFEGLGIAKEGRSLIRILAERKQ